MGNDLQLNGLDMGRAQFSHLHDIEAGSRNYDMRNPMDARAFADDVLDGHLDGKSQYAPGEEWSGVMLEGSTITAGDRSYDLRDAGQYARFMRDAADGQIDGQVLRERPAGRITVPSHGAGGSAGAPLDSAEADSLADIAQNPLYALVDDHWERTGASAPPTAPQVGSPAYVETRDHASNNDYASWTREDWKQAIKADPEKYTALFSELAMTDGGLSDDVTEHMSEVQQFVGAELQRFNRDMVLLKSIQDANHETLKALAQIRV